jgi:hypothetical protein
MMKMSEIQFDRYYRYIELPDGANLETGLQREDVGQLEGRAYKTAAPTDLVESTIDRLKIEWVINAPGGGEVKLEARHDRAGVVRAVVRLK